MRNVIQSRRNYQPTEVLRQPIFWLMYFMFVIVGAGGLMVTANLKPIAVDWKVDAIPVTLIGMTMTAVTFAATIDRVLNGLTRPFFGWISDMIGRENTMFIAFGMEGVGIWALYMLGHDPVWFVILSGFVFFAWGEIYSLFPSTCTDTFGAKFATTNAGLLYTAKGTAALLVPIANYMQQSSGTWDSVFIIAAGANILASLLAIAVLKPWRKVVVAKSSASAYTASQLPLTEAPGLRAGRFSLPARFRRRLRSAASDPPPSIGAAPCCDCSTRLRLQSGILYTKVRADACDDKSQLCDTRSQLKERAREDLMVSSTNAATPAPSSSGFRWLQLAMGIVCMAMIANLQYGWTLFVDPIDAKNHWGRASIQLAFTIFVVTETWLVPIEAWFVDKYGPSIVVMFGGVMIALAWVLNSYADSLTLLYAAAVVGGMGAGAVYGTCVGNALKWFPDRRGLAAGATAAGFGAGAAITVVPIATMIAASGYQARVPRFRHRRRA